MHALRDGYRVVRLRAPTGSWLQHGTLLVHLRTESREVAAVGPPSSGLLSHAAARRTRPSPRFEVKSISNMC